MKIITCAELQENLADILDYVIDDHAPVLINREDKQAVVIISLDDCSAFKETAYPLKIPANAKRLRDSLAQIEATETTCHKLSKECDWDALMMVER
ncbi:type II toxin-antitoxin system Phd/YefM family antitoxin [Acinetobacter towneri]|uniref:type II toxin-antitoxin system Phd/YefM family antitoxin n=1 Tax=Acinetobacter towneri TaxID=202956 RepID=UPI001CE1C804|nr:type II toxin-antitoxin system prevent-host-death family antitoxin [Acinetobacter towneri]MCA4790017.1 type II toxin-antitoxin system prevent-host-death family antitoxin [Acinetobacter towneri]